MNFSPSRSSTHGVTGSIGWASASARISVEARMLSEALEVAPGREDQPRVAAPIALQHLGRRSPSTRRRIRPRSRCGCQSPGGAARDEEQGVEAPHRVELRDPAGEGVSAPGSSVEPACSRTCANGRSAASARLELEARLGPGSGDVGRRGSRFPRSSRGSRRRPPASTPKRSPSSSVRFVDASAGEDQRAGGERHALGALDHQQLGRRPGRSPTTIRVAAGIASSVIAST